MILQPKYWIFSLLLLLLTINLSDAATQSVNPRILHIINRLSFGASSGDIQKVESMGVESYIKEQLSPESIPEPESLTSQLSQLQTLGMNPVQLVEYVATYPPRQKPNQEQKQVYRQRAKQIVTEAIEARLLRATTSPRQLQEVMVDFWYNHFNVYAAKGRDAIWVGNYEAQAIRPHALGHFRELLGATAHHPAMLFYLDNTQNRVVKGKAAGLNENYARELMELHTLGVDGGYSQQDVIALARILSGWGIQGRGQQLDNHDSGFVFNSRFHDSGDKVFLGHTIKSSGVAEGEAALDILARSPVTAHHISYQIAQYFVSDRPPETLVKQLTSRYLATDGDIREILKSLFHNPEFWHQQNFNNKFKTPYQYAISVVRATGVEVKNTLPIAAFIRQLAMPIYGCLTPDGYKNTKDTWLNPDAMTRRLSFATTVATGNLPLSYPQPQTSAARKNLPRIPVDAEQLMNTLGNFLSPKTQTVITNNPPRIRSALILGSPEFMYY